LWQDWPRIPLPASAAALQSSAALGRQVAALLDIEQAVPGVNVSAVRPELRVIGVLTAASGRLDPDAGDLDLTAGWGHGGKGGVTMPGKGKAVARPFAPSELGAALLGDTTYDVYLNGKAFWRNRPSAVWEYTLGGYQVIKKWLSYREKELLAADSPKRKRATSPIWPAASRRSCYWVLRSTPITKPSSAIPTSGVRAPSSRRPKDPGAETGRKNAFLPFCLPFLHDAKKQI